MSTAMLLQNVNRKMVRTIVRYILFPIIRSATSPKSCQMYSHGCRRRLIRSYFLFQWPTTKQRRRFVLRIREQHNDLRSIFDGDRTDHSRYARRGNQVCLCRRARGSWKSQARAFDRIKYKFIALHSSFTESTARLTILYPPKITMTGDQG